MKNYKITIEYDGTRYNGWQKQGNTKNTIEAKFLSVLSEMCGEKIEIFASGRTDAGVHAVGQVANFKCTTDKSPGEIMDYLNHYLPTDIRVREIEEAPERFHSRLCAKKKTYEYTLSKGKGNVFERKYVYAIDRLPNIEAMREASKLFLGTHDFKGFSSVGRTKKSTERTIFSIDILEDAEFIKVRITGSGFLYHMVRIMVGTLYEIGLGEMKKERIGEVLTDKVRERAGATLPACGLKLMEVFYE